MLAIAREKVAAAGLDIPFVCQDISTPYTAAPVDAATCFYGGLNFLNSSEALQRAFTCIYAALKPGGIFVFDQFSASKMRATFAGSQAADFNDFFGVTRSKCDAYGQVTRTVTFFLREPDGHYRREEEHHHIRIHPFEEITSLLEAAGFVCQTVESIYPQVNVKALQDVSLFVAQKP
jgi:SAM-dependent methyltransferase